MRRFPLLLCLVPLLFARPAGADDITLAEIVPALRGSEAGALVVAEEPAPGVVRHVRRSEVLAALRSAGLSANGLAIPRSTRIVRRPTELQGDSLRDRALPSIRSAMAPCTLQDIRLPRSVRLPPGEIQVRTDATPPVRSGRTSGVVIMSASGQHRRLPFSARANCPPPAVSAGSRIRLVARIGNVVATAPGEANQNGRIGQVIRVRNLSTRRALRARIIDGENAEIVR